MSNTQMVAGRFLRWANSRRLVRDITAHLLKGGTVYISTYTRATKFSTPAHAAMFKATRTGAYAQYGKKWLCIDYCATIYR